MKIVFLILLSTSLTFATIPNEKKANQILEKFLTVCKSIDKLEYDIQRIDTFIRGSHTTNILGTAYISRKMDDTKFGYYFFADNYNLHWQSIYDGTNSFEINTKEKTYKFVKSINGSPGHQLVMRIADLIFSPDNSYDRVVIANETKDAYTLELMFKDEPNSMVTNFKKRIVIDKKTFLPIKYEFSGTEYEKKYSHQFILKDMNINENVSTSIDKIKLNLQSFSQLPTEEKKGRVSLINSVAPNFLLQNLLNTDTMTEIYKNKLTLVDFWEVWCGHCITSMPKVELIFKKYSDELNVIGIVTQDTEYAKTIIDKFSITFQTLIGNNYVLGKYGVNSFPRYFLIDKKGIIRKEYFGFIPQIEKDIKKFLSK